MNNTRPMEAPLLLTESGHSEGIIDVIYHSSDRWKTPGYIFYDRCQSFRRVITGYKIDHDFTGMVSFSDYHIAQITLMSPGVVKRKAFCFYLFPDFLKQGISFLILQKTGFNIQNFIKTPGSMKAQSKIPGGSGIVLFHKPPFCSG